MCKRKGEKFLLIHKTNETEYALVVELENRQEALRVKDLITQSSNCEYHIYKIGEDEIPERHIEVAIECGFKI